MTRNDLEVHEIDYLSDMNAYRAILSVNKSDFMQRLFDDIQAKDVVIDGRILFLYDYEPNLYLSIDTSNPHYWISVDVNNIITITAPADYDDLDGTNCEPINTEFAWMKFLPILRDLIAYLEAVYG
jgi:hypothetical protein